MPKLNERLTVVPAVTPQNIGTADVTGAYIDVSNHRELLATLTTEVLTAASTATIELLQATDAAGTGAKAFVAAVTATAPVGNGTVTAEVAGSVEFMDSNNGFTHVAVKVTCSELAKIGAATIALGNGRY